MAKFSAFHTPRAAKYSENMRKGFTGLRLKPLKYPVYSAVSADLFPTDPDGIVELIVRNTTRAVRLRETIKKMHKEGFRVFVQLGGGGKLLATVEKILGLEPYISMSIDLEHMSGLQQMQYVVARMFALGIPMQPAVLFRYRDCRVLNLQAGSSPRVAPAVSLSSTNSPRLVDAGAQPVRTAMPPPPPASKVSPPPAPAPAPAMRAPAASSLQENARHIETRHTEISIKPARTAGAAVAQLSEIEEPVIELDDALGMLQQFEEPAVEVDDALDVLQQLADLDRQEEARYAKLVERMAQTGESIQTPRSPMADKASAHASVRYPLVGDITDLISGQELKSRLLLDLKVHRFLVDHSLLVVPDQFKDKRELLPTLPARMSSRIDS